MAIATVLVSMDASVVSAHATKPLEVTITSGPTNPSSDERSTLTFSASEAGTTYTCTLDASAPVPCTSPATFSVSSGPHVVTIVGRVPTGGQSPAATWNWTATGAGEGVLSPWAVQVENPSSNFAGVAPHQALLDAQHFNFIIAHPIAYQRLVGAMKRINPRLTLLAYLSGTFAQYTDGTRFPASWYERDAKGNKVTNHYGNYLMDPTVPGWIQNRIATCQTFLAESGYDGCYLDTLGLVALSGGWVSAPPINPRTAKVWTQGNWIAATSSLAGQIRASMSPVPVFGNGLTGGSTFYSTTASTKPLIDAMNGGIAEAWIRGSSIPITDYPPEAVWLQNVEMIGVVEGEQKPLLTLTKVHVAGTQSQIAQWGQFALASFLLGTGGRSAFAWSGGNTDRTMDYAYYHLAIGAPMGTYATVPGGAFRRTFTDGLVMVNPTRNPVVVTLAKPYYNTAGNQVTSVTIGSESGVILTANPAPATTIVSQPSASTASTAATIAFSSGTANVTFDCQIDGSAPAPCTSPVSLSNLAEGVHLLSVQAITPAGVVGPAALASWTVDVNPPSTTILSAPPSSSTSTTAMLSFTASKPASKFTCSLDGAAATPCTPGPTLPPVLATSCCGWTMTYTNLPRGAHHVSIHATDSYGLVGSAVTVSWTIT